MRHSISRGYFRLLLQAQHPQEATPLRVVGQIASDRWNAMSAGE